jgi:formylglycine-generating enzyme required for sulfatase activity
MTNCGPGGSGTESCCTTLEVAGGTYYRTYTNDDGGLTGEQDPATVSSFSLDKYLVTVGRFRQFVSAWNNGSGWMPPEGTGKHTYLDGGQGLVNVGAGADAGATYETGWDATDWNNTASLDPTDANLDCQSDPTWTASVATQESLPINCVTWYEAYAFCIWDGGFLPSEAEWEYAAAAGSQQREYPWGSADPGTVNEYAIYWYGHYTGTPQGIAPVGTASMGVGYYGQLDLAGDLFEWNLDWSNRYADPCTNCVDLSPAFDRVARGGSFLEGAAGLLAAARAGNPPTARSSGVGIRCARAP